MQTNQKRDYHKILILFKQMKSITKCYGLNVCTLKISYVEILTPKVAVLGGGAFEM